MHPSDLTYRNQIVRLSDLAVTADVIEGVTFESCQIIGPAVVVLLGKTELRNSGFDGDLGAVLWPLGQRDHVIGAVGLVDCTIVSCRFQRIGLGVPEDDMEKVRRGFGLT